MADKLDLPPTQDASHKWRFSLGFPTKNVIILVVTVTGWGVDLTDKNEDEEDEDEEDEEDEDILWHPSLPEPRK